jgi:V8-like Glu-specific endopeptidase
VLALLLGCALPALAADAPLRKVELARRGKAACALVEVKEAQAYGTAFCIHSSGLFLTNEHVIRPAHEGPITLILHPGLKDEKTFGAKVLRSDQKLDLALLRAEDAKDLAALPLGSNDSLTELMEVVALGFPFGKAIIEDKRSYPAISVNHGHITALRHHEGRLHRIQLDAALNPGNSGSPVLDEQGRVVGIVVAGVRGSGVNFAIPIDDARRFALQPDVHIVLPVVSRDTMHRPALFKVRVSSIVPLDKPLDLELTLTGPDGKDRKHKLEHDKDVYQVKAVPVPERQGPLSFPVTAEYEKGSVHGLVADRRIKVGGKEHALREISRLHLRPQPRADLVDGTVVKGAITGLEGLMVQVGEEQMRINLDRVVALQCDAPPDADAVACVVIARQDGKEIARAGDSITIHGMPEAATRPSGPAVGPTRPAALEAEKVVRPLPSTIGDLAVGGGGRFLVLHLPRVRKLAVFDVSAARVVKYIPLEEEGALCAAGQDKLVVVLPRKSVIQRWSLATLERERSQPLPVREQAVTMAMGSASQGPLLVGTASGIHFLDLQSLRPSDVHMPDHRPGGVGERTRIRASADGKVFGLWRADSVPQGMEVYTLIGHHLQTHYEHQSAGHVAPGPDGKVIFTRRGLYTSALKPRKEDNDGGAAYCVPAAQGPLYLSLTAGRPGKCALHMVGTSSPLVQLSDVEVPEGLLDDGSEALGSDRRFQLIPAAKVLVTIPASNDRLVLHRFDLVEALKKADIDYLLVMSTPPTVAKKGETLRYQLEVLSRKGGVSYRVDSGHKGMEITSGGLLQWAVPAKTEETEVSIILVVGDSAGQEVFHTFTLAPVDSSPAAKPPGEKTGPGTTPTTEGSKPAPASSGGKKVRPLPGTVTDAAVGGAGRYLVLHLSRERKLAIFDVLAGRITRYIPVTADNIKLTAGQDKVVVVIPDTNVIQRWDLATGKRDLSIPLAVKGSVKGVCMGSASQGPILVGSIDGFRGQFTFIDLRTLRPTDLKVPDRYILADQGVLRASADGKTFATWSPNTSPQGISLLTVVGKEVKLSGSGDSAGHVVPGPDGKLIFTGHGVYTNQGVRKGDDRRDTSYCLPAAQGELYLSIDLAGTGEGKKPRVTVMMPGDPARPLVTLTDLDLPGGINAWGRGAFGFDRRVLFLPNAGVIATIPGSADRVVLHPFDLVDALDKSGTDYLLVTSEPVRQAVKGTTYSYQLVTRSKKGEVKYRLDSGPDGMEVSATGLVKWAVPADLADKEVDVIVNVCDASGQEVFHGYKIGILDKAAARSEAPAPAGDKETRSKEADEPPSASGIKPPRLASDKVVKVVPSAITDMVVGGGGRYLVLYLAGDRKLAIFDVNEARITRYLALGGDNVKFTAGQDKVVVALPDTNVIQRWDLATGKRELSIPLAVKEKVQQVLMGSTSQGPILVAMGGDTEAQASFLDLRTLKPVQLKTPARGLGFAPSAYARASADGKVFGVWSPRVNPGGIGTLVITGNEVRSFYQHDSAGHIAPDAEGKVLCTGQGLWTPEGKRLARAPDSTYYIPAVQPGYVLAVRSGERFDRRGQRKSTLSLYLSGTEEPLATLPQVELPVGINPFDREPFGFDRHILFIPDAKLIVVVPETHDKLVLYRFDVVEALEESGTDYLIVTSQPPRTAQANAEYRYQVRARAKKGGINYRLDSAPEGMTISADGLITWKVPAQPKKETEVIVAVTDAAGQERFQSFTVTVGR